MTVDYLIVGQGICGTFLSWNLWQRNASFLVIDESIPFSSSKVASGVINPITGRKLVKTWMADELLPFATSQYLQLGRTIGQDLIKQCNILLFHASPQMQESFTEALESHPQYLHEVADAPWQEYFRFNYGMGEIDPALLINLHLMLHHWRQRLLTEKLLVEERFDIDQLRYTAESVQYREITARKIIFCNGTDAYDLPFFEFLPFSRNKGEALIAEIPGLPATNIYKQGLTIVPWQDGLFWIGSTYEWNFENLAPSPLFRKKAEEQLQWWLQLPCRIVDHQVAERPATLERRPFVGVHPVHPSIAILNGMGTKGCSLAPYFAQQLAAHLLDGEPISKEADVQRFKRILSR